MDQALMRKRKPEGLSFLGRMLRFHVLTATPSLYPKPQWQVYIIIAIVVILAIARWLG